MKSINIKITVAALLLTACHLTVFSQPELDQYVQEGLQSNILLKEKRISLKQAEQSLQIARSLFLPSVNALADYTSGKGGRSIDIPIGDLLNPVYASLNQLTQSDNFPQIQNVSQDFFPRNFYDAKIRTSIPLVNTDIHINKEIQSQKVLIREYEVEAYQRDLILNIKTAYYNYLSALAAVKIFESAIELVNRNVQINESLLKNGKTLPANLLRSRSEAEKIKAELNNSQGQVLNAQKYFNFLLNRPLDSAITTPTEFSENEESDLSSVSVSQREELQMLKSLQQINRSSVQLYQLSRLPKVSAFLDLGTQASNWNVNQDSRYYLVGVQLAMPIFQGFRNNIQIQQTKLEEQKSSLALQNTNLQLEVAAQVSANNVRTAKQNLFAAKEQLNSARSYFNLIDKGYQQGVNSLIEFIDARNQLTSSELQLNLRQYEFLTAQAELERQTASFQLQP
jgi:outer membrane protein